LFLLVTKKKKGAFTMQECFKEKKNPTLIEQKKKSHRNEKVMKLGFQPDK
jgi:hypothetical protein